MSTLANEKPILLFPRASLDQSAITSLRQRSNVAAQNLARGTNAISDLITRMLRPSDIVGPAGTTTAQLTNPNALVQNTLATNQFTNFTTGQTQGIVIYGFVVLQPTPFIYELQFRVGNLPVAILGLSELYAQGGSGGSAPKVGYLFDPILVPPQTHVDVGFMAAANIPANGEPFGIIGYVGEKQGDNVNLQHNPLGDYDTPAAA